MQLWQQLIKPTIFWGKYLAIEETNKPREGEQGMEKMTAVRLAFSIPLEEPFPQIRANLICIQDTYVYIYIYIER